MHMPDPINQDVRWRQRFQNFNQAFGQLSRAAALAEERPLSELEQQGLIQAFEFTHELAWNTLKDYLQAQGTFNLIGSRDSSRSAFAAGLIENGEVWMTMIHSRNQSTHTYNQERAQQIARAITSDYVQAFAAFQKKFKQLEQSDT